MRKASRGYLFIVTVLLLGGVSCGNPGGRTEITETHSVPVQPVTPSSTTPKQAGSPVATSAPNLQWDIPSGWTPVPATSMRLANFRVGPAQDTECFASALKGAAGGVQLIAKGEGYSVFVKMIGPMTTVQSQREAFIAFCGSLR
ncbi:MAG: hypothetical protein NTU83_04005 [Candidatus Hydrogenedentes bacterium]|nr:hypothetical protein [Candidatus Hydrogenedentota bacterium]